jgi:hypothetical protein
MPFIAYLGLRRRPRGRQRDATLLLSSGSVAVSLLLAIVACGSAQVAGNDTAASTAIATSAEANATAAAGGSTFRIHQGTGWSPLSLGIAPRGTITWQNFDTTSAHPVECAPLIPGHDPCPWSGTLALLPARSDASGAVVPSAVSLRFDNPGIFYFRDALHHAYVGEITCGAPGAPPGGTP